MQNRKDAGLATSGRESPLRAVLVLSADRPGTDRTRQIAAKLPGVDARGELFSPSAACDLSATDKSLIGERIAGRPFAREDDPRLIKLLHEQPVACLEVILDNVTTETSVLLFSIHSGHLMFGLMDDILASGLVSSCLLVRRRFIDVFISDQKVQETGQLSNLDTTDVRSEVAVSDFRQAYDFHNDWQQRVLRLADRHSIPVGTMEYETDIDCSDDACLMRLAELLGVELAGRSHGPDGLLQKQDVNADLAGKVRNWATIERELRTVGMLDLALKPLPMHGQDTPAGAGEPMFEMVAPDPSGSRSQVSLVTMLGAMDAMYSRQFISHYRCLGATSFHLILHGDWAKQDIAFLESQPDVVIERQIGGVFSDKMLCEQVNALLPRFKGRWVLHADADEFLELPFATLGRTIAALQVLGVDELPALLMQRQAPGGAMPMFEPDVPLDIQFPFVNFGLCEDMGVASPIWKNKFPLFLVTETSGRRDGNHLPPSGRSPFHAPVRAIVHHFKWTGELAKRLRTTQRNEQAWREWNTYQRYLEFSGDTLPMDGARLYSPSELKQRGFLVSPNRRELLLASMLRRARDGGSAGTLDRTRTQLERLRQDNSEVDLLDLLHKPGRICIVAPEITGESRSGGVGTAIGALAERLAAAGHRVEVVFCPIVGASDVSPTLVAFWQARGVKIHYLPRNMRLGENLVPHREFALWLDQLLDRIDFDVIHFVDTSGYGGRFASLVAAGLARQKAKIVMTLHGPTHWHRRGNLFAWHSDEPFDIAGVRETLELADRVIYPSRYMKAWIEDRFAVRAEGYVIPNGLLGGGRSFANRIEAMPPRRVNEIVLFCRLEHRKGLTVFCDALNLAACRHNEEISVTFLGKFGHPYTREGVLADIGEFAGRARFITNYDSIEAVNYLKTRRCVAVLPTLMDNLPYTVYECLENQIPLITSSVGGIGDLVAEDDQARVMVADTPEQVAQAIDNAVQNSIAPARLRFDPTMAEAQLLAVHAGLAEEARHSQLAGVSKDSLSLQPIDAVQYGFDEHGSKAVDGVVELDLTGLATRRPRRAKRWWARLANEKVEAASSDEVLMFDATVKPLTPHAATAMRSLMTAGNYDAVVCDFRVLHAGDAAVRESGRLSEPFVASPGAVELSPVWNIYGAGFFLIRRDVFVECGGFNDSLAASRLAHWELLNRLQAAGRKIAGVPRALVAWQFYSPDDYDASSDPLLCEYLTLPWLKNVDAGQEQIIRSRTAQSFGHDPNFWAVRQFLAGESDVDGEGDKPDRLPFFDRLWGRAG